MIPPAVPPLRGLVSAKASADGVGFVEDAPLPPDIVGGQDRDEREIGTAEVRDSLATVVTHYCRAFVHVDIARLLEQPDTEVTPLQAPPRRA
jgi:hypothetical protein